MDSRLYLLARSDSWADRAQAGSQLAPHAGDPQVDLALLALLDDANTAVPQQTARALLRQCTRSSVRVFLQANVQGMNEDAGSECRAELQVPGLPERLGTVLEDLRDDEHEAEDIRREAADARAWVLVG